MSSDVVEIIQNEWKRTLKIYEDERDNGLGMELEDAGWHVGYLDGLHYALHILTED